MLVCETGARREQRWHDAVVLSLDSVAQCMCTARLIVCAHRWMAKSTRILTSRAVAAGTCASGRGGHRESYYDGDDFAAISRAFARLFHVFLGASWTPRPIGLPDMRTMRALLLLPLWCATAQADPPQKGPYATSSKVFTYAGLDKTNDKIHVRS